MKCKNMPFLLVSILLLSTGCASIVSKSTYPINVNSTPSGAKITVTDKKGVEIYTGITPAEGRLKAGSGFFSRARYVVKFEKEGYDVKTVVIESSVDGWYFGNIVFGGLIGFLIVDPATGAMFKLDTQFIDESLTQSITSTQIGVLKVYAIDEIPDEWRGHLQELHQSIEKNH